MSAVNPQTVADPAAVIDLIDGFRRSKTMFAAVALGVFDRLQAGPSDSATLARDSHTNLDAMERLLDACVGLGFLRKQAGAYSNEPVAETYLCRSSSRTLSGYILYSNKALYSMWGNLEDAIREGSHRWPQTFGLDGPIFDHFFKTDADKREFLAGMHGFGLISSPCVAEAFDFSRFRRLVDLGGATGHLAVALCERNPNLHAVVLDLPPVIEVAKEYIGKTDCHQRIELISGNFFSDPLPEADLYSLGRIVHDWSEPKVESLLKKIFDRLPKGGALLLAERLLEDDKTGPVSAQMQSLSMLVCTEGKERTLPEYTALLRQAGFSSVQGRKTGTPLDAVIAYKNDCVTSSSVG